MPLTWWWCDTCREYFLEGEGGTSHGLCDQCYQKTQETMDNNPKFQINNEMERSAFRAFASLRPHEAAELNWPALVAMTQEVNPEITEPEIRALLEAS